MKSDAVTSVSKGLDFAVFIGLVCLDRFTTLLGARPFRNCHRDRPAPMEIAMHLMLQESFKTEVYNSTTGHIRISQHGTGVNGLVLLTPDQAEQILKSLPKLIETARLEIDGGAVDE